MMNNINFSGTSFFNPAYISKQDIQETLTNISGNETVEIESRGDLLTIDTETNSTVENALKSFIILLAMETGVSIPKLFQYTRFNNVNEQVVKEAKLRMDKNG